jgi:hypothetical protein
MHKVVAPGSDFFPRTHAKVVACVERTHIVQELRSTGIELRKTDIVQHTMFIELDLLPKTENGNACIG